MQGPWHVALLPPDFVAGEVVVAALEVVVQELDPLAASFFTVDGQGQAKTRVVQGPHLGPPERIGAVDDLRLLIRDGSEPIAGIAVWRPLRSAAWSDRQRRLLHLLQPLVERAYVHSVREIARIDARLPTTLTGRQRQVARLLAAGATTPEIARSLFVSANTAKSHAAAAMSKLGVSSRRALALLLAGAPDPTAPAPEPPAPVGRLEGDRQPGALLDAVLGWAAERLGATVGGCVLVSTRMELTGEAWGTRAGESQLRLAWRLHRQIVGSGNRPGVVLYLEADRAQRRVVQLDLTDFPANDELDQMVAAEGLSSPLIAALRAHGRLAGLVWLCRDAERGPDVSESARALRRVHALMELGNVTAGGQARGASTDALDLAELGLTPREITVAELALAGRGNAAIASAMGISESTVKKHMTRILAKCGVRSRTQLIALLRDTASVGAD